MDRPTRSRPLVWGAVASVLLHLAGAAWLSARPSVSHSERSLQVDGAEPLAPRSPSTLGLDAGAVTSITWIGVADDPKPQTAIEASPVDQAQFTPAEGVPDAVTAAPALAQALAAPSPPDVSKQEPAPVQDPVEPSVVPAVPDASPAVASSPPPVLTAEKGEQAASEPDAEPAPAPELPPEPVTPSVPAAPASSPPVLSPGPAAIPSTPGQIEGRPGEVSDRESDAAATIVATTSQLGRPLAARGLEIRTVRPRFTQYTRLTVKPQNPHFRVSFDRSGKVRNIEVLRSSGARDVDRPLLDALYQWHASGSQVTALPAHDPNALLSVDFRILL